MAEMDLVALPPRQLEELLAREWPRDPAGLPQVEQEEFRFLLRMVELARGLVDSEYWELLRVVLIGDLELAKASLENISLSEKDLRVSQGKAAALLSLHNFILKLSRGVEENVNGEE
jgi:hypothetical protein